MASFVPMEDDDTSPEQTCCVKWYNFKSALLSSFRDLRDQKDFVDVTLVCEECSFAAHKVVLSTCSPFFKRLLKANPCQHPIIILSKDIQPKHLESLMTLMYNGKVNVKREDLIDFLKTAQILNVTELTKTAEEMRNVLEQDVASSPPSSETDALRNSASKFPPTHKRCSLWRKKGLRENKSDLEDSNTFKVENKPSMDSRRKEIRGLVDLHTPARQVSKRNILPNAPPLPLVTDGSCALGEETLTNKQESSPKGRIRLRQIRDLFPASSVYDIVKEAISVGVRCDLIKGAPKLADLLVTKQEPTVHEENYSSETSPLPLTTDSSDAQGESVLSSSSAKSAKSSSRREKSSQQDNDLQGTFVDEKSGLSVHEVSGPANLSAPARPSFTVSEQELPSPAKSPNSTVRSSSGRRKSLQKDNSCLNNADIFKEVVVEGSGFSVESNEVGGLADVAASERQSSAPAQEISPEASSLPVMADSATALGESPLSPPPSKSAKSSAGSSSGRGKNPQKGDSELLFADTFKKALTEEFGSSSPGRGKNPQKVNSDLQSTAKEDVDERSRLCTESEEVSKLADLLESLTLPAQEISLEASPVPLEDLLIDNPFSPYSSENVSYSTRSSSAQQISPQTEDDNVQGSVILKEALPAGPSHPVARKDEKITYFTRLGRRYYFKSIIPSSSPYLQEPKEPLPDPYEIENRIENLNSSHAFHECFNSVTDQLDGPFNYSNILFCILCDYRFREGRRCPQRELVCPLPACAKRKRRFSRKYQVLKHMNSYHRKDYMVTKIVHKCFHRKGKL